MHIQHAQRKHIIHSLDALLYQLHALSFILSPALWVYLARVISQFQFSRPRQMDPKRPLRVWFILAFLFNVGALWTHALDSSQGHRSVIVDFLGMARPPSKIHLLLLDCLIIFLEILLTTIAYETALSGESPSFSSNTTQSNPNTPIIEPSSPFGDRPENSNGEWAASQYIVDVRLSSIFERLRSPPPPPPVQDESDGDLLPLPNTTPWRLSSTLRFVMQARTRRGERERQRETAGETSGTIPGGLDVNERT